MQEIKDSLAITIENPRIGQQLFGPNDQFFKIIESAFAAKILTRDDQLLLKGEQEVITPLYECLQVLIELIKGGFQIHERDLTYAISIAKGGRA